MKMITANTSRTTPMIAVGRSAAFAGFTVPRNRWRIYEPANTAPKSAIILNITSFFRAKIRLFLGASRLYAIALSFASTLKRGVGIVEKCYGYA